MEELKRRQNEKKREEAKLKLQASKQKAEDKRILEEEEQSLKQKVIYIYMEIYEMSIFFFLLLINIHILHIL